MPCDEGFGQDLLILLKQWGTLQRVLVGIGIINKFGPE
jgi:hypothetical protein